VVPGVRKVLQVIKIKIERSLMNAAEPCNSDPRDEVSGKYLKVLNCLYAYMGAGVTQASLVVHGKRASF
jgi:hypothetical protein